VSSVPPVSRETSQTPEVGGVLDPEVEDDTDLAAAAPAEEAPADDARAAMESAAAARLSATMSELPPLSAAPGEPLVAAEAATAAPDKAPDKAITTFRTPKMKPVMNNIDARNGGGPSPATRPDAPEETWPRPAAPRVITIANQKGGVGKTTSTVNIAAALAMHGVRVLVIDLDPQGNASTALGIEHNVGVPSIYDVILGGRPLAEIAQDVEFADGLRCAPATLDLAGADIELTTQVAREYRLQRAIQAFLELDDPPDYILIDCPPSLGLLTLNALVAAAEVLIPIQCEYYALEGLAQLLNTVELVRAHLNPALWVSTVLLTMYDSRTKLADQVKDEVRNHFGGLVLEPIIPRNVRVSEAPGFGQTVMTYDAGSRGAVGYLQAARELAHRAVPSQAPAREAHEEPAMEGPDRGPDEPDSTTQELAELNSEIEGANV
jgi:chromosome partitioning protein